MVDPARDKYTSESKEESAIGSTQAELAASARYVIAGGVMVADDVMRSVDREVLRGVDTRAAFVVHIVKPVPAWFFVFGSSPAFIGASGCGPIVGVSKTAAEYWGSSLLVRALDPDGHLGLRQRYMMIDLVACGGSIVRTPTDADIAELHVRYHETHGGSVPQFVDPWSTDEKIEEADAENTAAQSDDDANPTPVPPPPRRAADARKTMPRDAKLRRELRALDRRRYVEAGIVPPPERIDDLRKIQQAVDNKLDLDPTIDDSDTDNHMRGVEPDDRRVRGRVGDEHAAMWNRIVDHAATSLRVPEQSDKTFGDDLFADDLGDGTTDVSPENRGEPSRSSPRLPVSARAHAARETGKERTATVCHSATRAGARGMRTGCPPISSTVTGKRMAVVRQRQHPPKRPRLGRVS